MKSLVYILALVTFGLADSYIKECEFDYAVMYEVASNEKHPSRPTGYPYLISFNNKEDVKKLPSSLAKMMLDGRTMDCVSVMKCTNALKYLDKNNIKNLDLGAFQLNYRYHKLDDLSGYFKISKSYTKACSYLSALKEQYGWSWKTLGSYHSKTPKYNKKYYKKIKNRVYGGSNEDS